jgi:ribosomal protein L11 methyltransferase
VDYVQLTAEVGAADAERAADILRQIADSGAWIERPFVQPDLESGAIVDDTAPVCVHVYLRGAEAAANASLARTALAADGIDAMVTARGVAEEDWAEAWKEHFHVERFGERIVVVPSWRTYDAEPGDAVVLLDPGMAFGTGQHETTRMCLEALDRLVRPGTRVLDAGCGSGILSLAVAKLGAAEVLAVDIDPECARITDENARRNGVEGIVRAGAGSVNGASWPFAQPATGFNIVVANIIAGAIIDLAAELVGALAPSGRLIVSGVIGEKERAVVDVLARAGARVECSRAMGDWRCIEARRIQPPASTVERSD